MDEFSAADLQERVVGLIVIYSQMVVHAVLIMVVHAGPRGERGRGLIANTS